MSSLKMKITASVVMLAITASFLSFSTANTAYAYLSPDVNGDGVVNTWDITVLGMAWGTRVGAPNYNPLCDFNQDGVIDIKDASYLAIYWTRFMDAQVAIMPEALNVKSHGNWITCIISLPKGINASQVEISSIRLNGTITASLGAVDENATNELMVKFSREEVIALVQKSFSSGSAGKFASVTLTVTGNLITGFKFMGSDTIRVLHVNGRIEQL